MSGAKGPGTVRDRSQGLQVLRQMLHVKPETAQDSHLHRALDELMAETH